MGVWFPNNYTFNGSCTFFVGQLFLSISLSLCSFSLPPLDSLQEPTVCKCSPESTTKPVSVAAVTKNTSSKKKKKSSSNNNNTHASEEPTTATAEVISGAAMASSCSRVTTAPVGTPSNSNRNTTLSSTVNFGFISNKESNSATMNVPSSASTTTTGVNPIVNAVQDSSRWVRVLWVGSVCVPFRSSLSINCSSSEFPVRAIFPCVYIRPIMSQRRRRRFIHVCMIYFQLLAMNVINKDHVLVGAIEKICTSELPVADKDNIVTCRIACCWLTTTVILLVTCSLR